MRWNSFFTSIFKKRKKDKKSEYYFGLILKEERGTALILKINKEERKIVAVDEKGFPFSDSWEGLVDDVDEILYQLEQSNKIKVEKIIFFLYSHLVDQKKSQINQPYLAKIKRLVKELELKPLGYIEHHEALSVYLSQKEEIPLTAIIIEFDKSSISLFVYKAAQLVFSNVTARTEDLAADIENILNKINQRIILPTRIIIYNSSGLEDEVNKINNYRWKENLFIQIPRVEIISYNQIKKALIYSFSEQVFQEEGVKAIGEEKEEVMGFVIGKEIKKTEEKLIGENLPEKKPTKGFLPTIKFNFIPSISIASINHFLLIGFVLIVSSIFSLLYFFHQASVVLYFQGKEINKEIVFDNNEVSVKRLNQTIEKEKSIETSGKKVVGEKAKGEVTIYNSTKQEKQFKKGTILENNNGVKFFLDDDVLVASGSQTLTNEGNLLTITGKAKGKITAVEIGPSGNIDKDVKLKIDNLSSDLFFAITNDGLKGGSRREIQTVSQDDMEKLKQLVSQEIKKQLGSLVKDKTKGEQIIDSFTEVEIIKEQFSKELGEEGKSLSLKVNAKATFYTFNKEDMKRTILKALKTAVEPDYKLSKENINYSLKKTERKDKEIVLTVDVSAKALPNKDKEQLVGQLTGKRLEDLNDIVKKQLRAQGYEVKTKTTIPFLKSRLPFFKKNIELKISSL